MTWGKPLMILLMTGCFAVDAFQPSPQDNFNSENFNKNPQKIDLDGVESENLDEMMRFLTKVLVTPWPDGALPLIYIDKPDYEDINEENDDNEDVFVKPELVPVKRSRYYRKYPWKRQNSRYDPTNRYLCNPTRDEVYRLLTALHEARQGNREKVVDFCNRKKPAYAVFTNIRFIGKK